MLDLFFGWRPPAFDEWEKAVEEFKGRVQELGENLARLIRSERQTNAKYQAAFTEFPDLCRASLNPNLSESAVEEMVINTCSRRASSAKCSTSAISCSAT